MEVPSIAVHLDPEMDKSLREYICTLTRESIDQVRKEASLSKEWLRKGEASKFIGISPKILNDWIDKGLKTSVVEGVTLISKNSITEFLIEHEK